MGTPNTKNHTLGKGSVFLDKLDPNTGNPTGERHLGNAPALGFNMTLEMLEHFSSMEKIRSKDVKMVIEAAPKFTFTLDEPVADNLGLTFMGSAEDVTESANDARTKTFTGVNANRYYDLGVRNVGVWVLPYKNGTAILNEGATVSGAVGEGVILQVVGDVTSGTLYIKTVTPGFVLDEAITDDGGTPGAAECAAVESFDTAALDVFDTATPATKLAAGTDFTVDSKTGRIYMTEAGVAVATDITVNFGNSETTYKRVSGVKETTIEGFIRYVSKNPRGVQMEFKAWKCSVTATGDFAAIGDSWQEMTFEAEILDDTANHPNSPYFDVLVDEPA